MSRTARIRVTNERDRFGHWLSTTSDRLGEAELAIGQPRRRAGFTATNTAATVALGAGVGAEYPTATFRDNRGGYSYVAGHGVLIPVGMGGEYLVEFDVLWTGAVTFSYAAVVRERAGVASGQVFRVASGVDRVGCTGTIEVAAGDYLRPVVYGAGASVTGQYFAGDTFMPELPRFRARRVGA